MTVWHRGWKKIVSGWRRVWVESTVRQEDVEHTYRDHHGVLRELGTGKRVIVPEPPPKPAAPAVTTSTLTIYKRASWSLHNDVSLTYAGWDSHTPTRVHHTASTAPSDSVSAEKAFMVETERYHMTKPSDPYRAIGYNYIIMPSGRVYEGRGAERVGAHTLGYNHDAGICFAGNFEHDHPTEAALTAFRALRKQLGLDGGVMYPHCRTFGTSCPGANLRAKLGLSC